MCDSLVYVLMSCTEGWLRSALAVAYRGVDGVLIALQVGGPNGMESSIELIGRATSTINGG